MAKETTAYQKSIVSELRSIADQDYMTARICYRYGLYRNFGWSAAQSIEKYLKICAMCNDVEVKRTHCLAELMKALSKVDDLEKSSSFRKLVKNKDVITDLQRLGRPDNRYGRFDFRIHNNFDDHRTLSQYDETISALRPLANFRYAKINEELTIDLYDNLLIKLKHRDPSQDATTVLQHICWNNNFISKDMLNIDENTNYGVAIHGAIESFLSELDNTTSITSEQRKTIDWLIKCPLIEEFTLRKLRCLVEK